MPDKKSWKPRFHALHTPDGAVCLLIVIVIFGYMGSKMGATNMINTMMATSYDLLMKTVFYLMSVCVLTGAISKIFIEFGVVKLLEKCLRPLMRPLYNLPGVASLGAVLTFLSDNPAIMSLARDKRFASYFRKYQFISFCNFGTAFGMGLIVVVFMISKGWYWQPFVGIIGAACGGIVATRLMQHFILQTYPQYKEEWAEMPIKETPEGSSADAEKASSTEAKPSMFLRILNSCLDGGRDGVNIGLAIIPGVLIITTFVIMITNGADLESGLYTGGPREGVGLLPYLASKIDFVFEWLFGFQDSRFVAFPITALGAVGAALSLVDQFKESIDGNAIAVFTAMGMCWSGFLSTHTAMLDTIGYRDLTAKDILAQICGGITAGIVAHWLYVCCTLTGSFFAPAPLWQTPSSTTFATTTQLCFEVDITAMDDGSYVVKDWYGVPGANLSFTVNKNDSTINVINSYDKIKESYYLVRINNYAESGDIAYAVLYTSDDYSEFNGNAQRGYFYTYTFLYDRNNNLIDEGFYEVDWGGHEKKAPEISMEEKSDTNSEKDLP